MSSRSYMNDSGDVSTLHYYRAQQRQQKRDSLIASAATVQKEAFSALGELGGRIRQHHSLGLVMAEIERLYIKKANSMSSAAAANGGEGAVVLTEDEEALLECLEGDEYGGHSASASASAMAGGSQYFPPSVITAYDAALSHEQQLVMQQQNEQQQQFDLAIANAKAQSTTNNGGGGDAQSLLSRTQQQQRAALQQSHEQLRHLQFLMSVAKDFVRIEKYVGLREGALRASQQTFAEGMAKVAEASAKYERLRATMGEGGVGGGGGASSSQKSPPIGGNSPSDGDNPLFRQATAASISGSDSVPPPILVGGGGQQQSLAASSSRLPLARERVRHLTERLAFLEQQTPAEAEADLAAVNVTTAASSAGGNGIEGNTITPQSQQQQQSSSSEAFDDASPSPMLATSVDTLAGGSATALLLGGALLAASASESVTVAAAGGGASIGRDVFASPSPPTSVSSPPSHAENPSPSESQRQDSATYQPPKAAAIPPALTAEAIASPNSVELSPSTVGPTSATTPAAAATPLEVAHRRRVAAEHTKRSLLAARHDKLAAVKALMVDEGRARRAIQREWAAVNPLEVYMEAAVRALGLRDDPSAAAQASATTANVNATDAVETAPSSTIHSPRNGDTPLVPGVPAAAVPQQQTPSAVVDAHSASPTPLVSPFLLFRRRQDALASQEVRRLQSLIGQRSRELEALEDKAALIREELAANAAEERERQQHQQSSPHSVSSTTTDVLTTTATPTAAGSFASPADRLAALAATVAAQEAQIAEQQDVIVGLERDLSFEGDYVDLEAMLLELRPMGASHATSGPPMGAEAASTLGKMSQWAAAYGNHLIDCAKEMAMAEADAIRLSERIAAIEVERSDFSIRAQYRGAGSAEQRQLDALDRYRALEATLRGAEREANELKAGVAALREQAKGREVANAAIDAARQQYFGRAAELEGAKRDLQREADQMAFVLASVHRAMESLDAPQQR